MCAVTLRAPVTYARLVLVLAAFGCGSAASASSPAPASTPDAAGPPAPAPVTQFVGEMHLHQFPLASHAWAAFIDPPLPLHSLTGDSVTEIDSAITSVEGPCTLYVLPTCAPSCAGATFCQAPNQCAPLPSWKYVDGGDISVTGSTAVALIQLWFDASSGSYLANPPPGSSALFKGGEQLAVAGGPASAAFEGELPAPLPVVVTAPDPSTDLRLPLSGPLTVQWVSQNSDQMELLVSSSSNAGATTDIRCVTGDTGTLTIPDAFVSALPRPPRMTRLEVMRVEQRVLPIGTSGNGVLVHAAYSNWHNGMD